MRIFIISFIIFFVSVHPVKCFPDLSGIFSRVQSFQLSIPNCRFENNSNFQLIKNIPIKASFLTTDNLGNFYLVVNNELQKYTINGELLYRFSNKTLGTISFIDVTNPLKILLFYDNFKQIVFLDKTLTLTGNPLSLTNQGLIGVTLACVSHNIGIWLYDEQTIQLIRLNQDFQIANQSGNISQQIGYEIKPNYLCEYNNWVYLNNPETGILVFDVYGTYFKTIPIKNIKTFQVIDDKIFYFTDDSFKSYDLKTFLEESVLPQEITLSDVKSIRIGGSNYLYILRENNIEIYQMK